MGLIASLSSLIEVSGHLTGPWWIIGGAATALYAGDQGDDLHDVDVIVSVADARRLIERLDIEDRTDGGSERFRSRVYATWWLDLPVDFLGDFEVKINGTWRPVRPQTRNPFSTPAGVVFMPSLEEHIEITRTLGRPRDFERIARLRG